MGGSFQGVQLGFNLQAPLGYECARGVDALDVTQRFQVRQGGADRRSADPKLGGKPTLLR